MRVRLGYVAIALGLEKVTSSSQVTYSYYQKMGSQEKQLDKLKQTTLSNLEDLEKILEYNVDHGIHFYRITSKLVPLATHPEVLWDYKPYFKNKFAQLGNRLNDWGMRVDTHPDQFNVINSINSEVVENTKINLMLHADLFDLMNYNQGKMILHVGSAAGGKEAALERFIINFKSFPEAITSRLLLENDDKTFTVRETLSLCQQLGVPMVLDIHHHLCNDGGDDIEYFLEAILKTWDNELLPPKMHISSPRDHPGDRKHADYIDGETFVKFLESCKVYERDIDFMIEAKMKDFALFNLMEQIKALRPNWHFIDESTFEI